MTLFKGWRAIGRDFSRQSYLNLVDRIAMLRRDLVPMAIAFALVASAGLSLAILTPVQFTAQARLRAPSDQGLNYARWDLVVATSNLAAPTSVAPGQAEGVTQSAMDHLTSRRLMQKVLLQLGLAQVYPDLGRAYAAASPTARQVIVQRAVLRAIDGLDLDQQYSSSTVNLTFSHTSPRVAAQVLNALMRVYLSEQDQPLGIWAQVPGSQAGVALQAKASPTVAAKAPAILAPASPEKLWAQRQLAGKRQALAVLDKSIADQAQTVGLSHQGLVASLVQDGREHGFGFNTNFQSLQIRRRQLEHDIWVLKRKIADTDTPSSPKVLAPLQVAAVAAPTVSDAGQGPARPQILILATVPKHGHSLSPMIAVFSLMIAVIAALCFGLWRGYARPGFGSAQIAARTLDLPVLATVRTMVTKRTRSRNAGFG